jgi:hypothetical protein
MNMTSLNVQRISGLLWLLMVFIFSYLQLHAPENYSEISGNLYGLSIGMSFIIGVISFIVMFLATVAYTRNLKHQKKDKVKKTNQFTMSPWFYVSLALLISLVYILGRRSSTPVTQPNIIVQPPQQQAPIIIQQQPVQPRMKIENTNCYYIGSQLHCNTYSY